MVRAMIWSMRSMERANLREKRLCIFERIFVGV